MRKMLEKTAMMAERLSRRDMAVFKMKLMRRELRVDDAAPNGGLMVS